MRRSSSLTFIGAALILMTGCAADSSGAGAGNHPAEEGSDLQTDTEGNFLTSEQFEVRNSLISKCTTSDDAASVRGFWNAEEHALGFDQVFIRSLDGLAESPNNSKIPSFIASFPEGYKHLSESTESCADIVSALPYASNIEQTDALLAQRAADGTTNPDFTFFYTITDPIENEVSQT